MKRGISGSLLSRLRQKLIQYRCMRHPWGQYVNFLVMRSSQVNFSEVFIRCVYFVYGVMIR